MPWTRVNTNPLWINNALCTFLIQRNLCSASSVCYTCQHLHQQIEEHKRTAIRNHLSDQQNVSQMTLREIVGKSQSKLDCLIFGMLFIILRTETNTKQTERFHHRKLFV